MAKPKTYPVRVRVREVPYLSVTENLLGQPALVELVGYGPGQPQIEPSAVLDPDVEVGSDEYNEAEADYRLGELIYVTEDDYLRLVNAGAVKDPDEVDAEAEAEALNIDPAGASVDELAEWISEQGPNVQETVNASRGEPEIAQKLLEAETQAKDGNPRDGVVKGLTAVISQG